MASFNHKCLAFFANSLGGWEVLFTGNRRSRLIGAPRIFLMRDVFRSAFVNAHHRSDDVHNLFLCDGSSSVTSGRGQPGLGGNLIMSRGLNGMASPHGSPCSETKSFSVTFVSSFGSR